MNRIATIAALALSYQAFISPAAAQEAEAVTPNSVVAAATPDEWVAIAPEDLLVMDLAPDAQGRARRVVIQLLPPPFSQPWVENIRTLAVAHWWDGTSVYRVVDNWVAQWGGGEGEGFVARALPEGVVSTSESYSVHLFCTWSSRNREHGFFDCPFDHPGQVDAYVPLGLSGFINGWPIHCYAHVGVARDLAPDTGTGAELYAVIGHAPRQLDRNIAVVGRVIAGIEHLSTLPRGTGDAGVYEDRAADTLILSVRLGNELAEPPTFEYLATESESFARYVEIRANRQDAFYTLPAGGVDICNVQVPIRRAER